MRKHKETDTQLDLDEVLENLRPGERHEMRDATGKVVAVLGAPSDETADETTPPPAKPASSKRSPHSAWLE